MRSPKVRVPGRAESSNDLTGPPNALGAQRLERLVGIDVAEVHVEVAAEMRQARLQRERFEIVGVLGLRLGLGAAHDGGQAGDDLHLVGLAPGRDHPALDVCGDAFESPRGRHHEDALGVLGGEVAPSIRRACLVDHRRALRRRLGQVRSRHRVVRAVVVDRPDAGRIGIDTALGVGQHSTVRPAALPELVTDVQVVLGPLVARVVLRQRLVAEALCTVLQVRRDDVPRHTPAGEVIERGDLSGEGERVRLQHVAGERKPEDAR